MPNNKTNISVQPTWMMQLPLQQQSVLMLATRGPDGIAKSHPCKDIQRAYRATVLLAGKYGKELPWTPAYLTEKVMPGDSFMNFEKFWDYTVWSDTVERFYNEVDSLPHHFIMHILHASEILAYKHPDVSFRMRWYIFYQEGVKSMHLNIETEEEMDARLSDWNRDDWDEF